MTHESAATLAASAEFDVIVTAVELLDAPARVSYRVRAGGLEFTSRVTYHSIAAWEDVWAALADACDVPRLIAVLVAWDAMRFLALGGERLVLPSHLPCDEATAAAWRTCFLRQFGEWRYRNRLRYGHGDLPRLEAPRATAHGRGDTVRKGRPPRALLTNGGGKDTLAGALLLNGAGVAYDVYEGYLPVGGSVRRQAELLGEFRRAVVPQDARLVAVSVQDDFYDRPEHTLRRAGVRTVLYKTDFAVGHTANYIGYLPVILAHGYDQVWFNIERSADDPDITWDGEEISHQWCKSRAYQSLARDVMHRVTGCRWFKGFDSTLRALYDTAIYEIVAQRPDLLRVTHSCNYGKPWCGRCPKCCFCYLMMSALLGEEFAMEVMGTDASVLAAVNRPTWESLLDPGLVAWECVPSHEECLIAVDRCLQRGMTHAVLHDFAPGPARAAELRQRYARVAWQDVPPPLTDSLRKLLRGKA